MDNGVSKKLIGELGGIGGLLYLSSADSKYIVLLAICVTILAAGQMVAQTYLDKRKKPE
jgi:hypothetical protein